MENIKIKKIPVNDRPRERLMLYGAKSLSNEELLSIILNSGTRNISVKNLASLIISKAGNIKNLRNFTYHDLLKIEGIGKVKACTLLSLIELSIRMSSKFETVDKIKLNDPEKVYYFYKDRININQEEFYCIYLDAKKRIIKDKLVFIGTVNHSLVHPRDIFKEAYNLNACFIICVHNHPSGDVSPSRDDIGVTDRLIEIGNLMGVKILDHIIVSKENYYSFLENGRI
ncbi:MAG: DNA repair protein RadC [Bacilli bacterium]|nr:DNA repair protein RadC [Bacilli bacterium]